MPAVRGHPYRELCPPRPTIRCFYSHNTAFAAQEANYYKTKSECLIRVLLYGHPYDMTELLLGYYLTIRFFSTLASFLLGTTTPLVVHADFGIFATGDIIHGFNSYGSADLSCADL